jgi:cation diffusion facilitator CzcD-associated flavoprotein CzcO
VDAHQIPVIDHSHDVVIVGAGSTGAWATELFAVGIDDFVIFDREVASAVFDDDTDTWTLTTGDGETCRGRVVVACQSPFVPWIPDLFGRRTFRGVSFHAAAAADDFDPAGQRIAMIGADAAGGQLIGRLARSGAEVTVFPLPPRRVVRPIRRAGRYLRRRHAKVVVSPIEEATAVGVRTADGVHHDADAIVYGTGFKIAAGLSQDTLVGARGLTIQHAWTDGMEPYLGVALHGFPNYFILSGPEFEAAMHYVTQCLRLMRTHTRIEVRRSSQQVFNEQAHLRTPPRRLVASAFDLSSSSVGVHEDSYDGPATLTIAGTCQEMRVRLIGHIDPIDGQYHWQGTLFGRLPAELPAPARAVTLTVGERSAAARITEETTQGTHSIAGVGAPPFMLADVELTVVQR